MSTRSGDDRVDLPGFSVPVDSGKMDQDSTFAEFSDRYADPPYVDCHHLSVGLAHFLSEQSFHIDRVVFVYIESQVGHVDFQ